MDAMDKMDNQELISALADGQLRGDEFARGVEAACADAGARQAWCSYHLVGEVLRTGRASGGAAPEAFLAAVRQGLQVEQLAVRPAKHALATIDTSRPAANEWVWKLAAGVASVAAVAAVGWNMWGGSAAIGQPQLAKAPVPGIVEASVPMVRDSRLDKLLAAHRQLGGTTALGTTSGFLRNATFEGPNR